VVVEVLVVVVDVDIGDAVVVEVVVDVVVDGNAKLLIMFHTPL